MNMKLYAYQIFRALNYLSILSIAHRDMKPQNILVDMTKNKAIICDFGSAKKLVKGNLSIYFSWTKSRIHLFKMLQGTWVDLRSNKLQHPNRHVVNGMHPRRNGQRIPSIFGRFTNWPTYRNHQSFRNSFPVRCWGNESKVRYERIQ
jgi:serine/threonine protein kinase